MPIIKLGEICFITKLSGFEYSKYLKDKFNFGEVPLIQASDINNNSLNLKKTFWITNNLSNFLLRSKPKKNDILFSYVGTIGNNYLVKDENLHLGSNVAIIRALQHMIKPKFLYFFLNSKSFKKELNRYIKGTTQLNIKMKDIRLIKINLLSLIEQQEIIDIIEPIENFETKILNIKNKLIELLVTIYNKLKSKNQISFQSIIEILSSSYERQNKYFATNAISEFEINYEKVIFLSKKIPSRAEISPIANSFIFSKLKGENKLFYFKEKPKEVFSTGFFNFQTKYQDHILGFMLSDEFKIQKEYLSTGTTMQSLNNSSLKLIKLNKPKYQSSIIAEILYDLEKKIIVTKKLKSKLINLLIN